MKPVQVGWPARDAAQLLVLGLRPCILGHLHLSQSLHSASPCTCVRNYRKWHSEVSWISNKIMQTSPAAETRQCSSCDKTPSLNFFALDSRETAAGARSTAQHSLGRNTPAAGLEEFEGPEQGVPFKIQACDSRQLCHHRPSINTWLPAPSESNVTAEVSTSEDQSILARVEVGHLHKRSLFS